MKPRKPTGEEKRELVEYVAMQKYQHPTEADLKEAREEAEGWLAGAAVAVFDHYITDGPGYTGKVMVVVWAYPEMTETYIWPNNLLRRVEIETGIIKDNPPFTREELQVIVKALFSTLKEWPENLDHYHSIQEKIESMLHKEKE